MVAVPILRREHDACVNPSCIRVVGRDHIERFKRLWRTILPNVRIRDRIRPRRAYIAQIADIDLRWPRFEPVIGVQRTQPSFNAFTFVSKRGLERINPRKFFLPHNFDLWLCFRQTETPCLFHCRHNPILNEILNRKIKDFTVCKMQDF